MKLPYRVSMLLGLLICAGAGAANPPPERAIRVAFVVSNGLNVMDFAGPWEVFQDVMLPVAGAAEDHRMPFELYTVAASTAAVTTTGGARVIPSYSFRTAPRPDIVVIGAQADNSPAMLAWLRTQYAGNATLASVCTGARKLALSGLLDGKTATTHHDYVADFRDAFPRVQWLETRRFVHGGERLYTAGGLTSGIDLALHLVAVRFGAPVAQATADYMEYAGEGWRQPD